MYVNHISRLKCIPIGITRCQDMSVLGSVNVLNIHERYAYDLFSWGDYEGAVGHFLVAETPVDHVLSLFPSLAPPEFVPPVGSLQGGLLFPL